MQAFNKSYRSCQQIAFRNASMKVSTMIPRGMERLKPPLPAKLKWRRWRRWRQMKILHNKKKNVHADETHLICRRSEHYQWTPTGSRRSSRTRAASPPRNACTRKAAWACHNTSARRGCRSSRRCKDARFRGSTRSAGFLCLWQSTGAICCASLRRWVRQLDHRRQSSICSERICVLT